MHTLIEPSHEIMALFVLRKLILQTRMRSHPVGLDVWCLVGPIVYFHTLCVRTAKALARLRGYAGSPEPSLVAYVISTIISWAGSIMLRAWITSIQLGCYIRDSVTIKLYNKQKCFFWTKLTLSTMNTFLIGNMSAPDSALPMNNSGGESIPT